MNRRDAACRMPERESGDSDVFEVGFQAEQVALRESLYEPIDLGCQ